MPSLNALWLAARTYRYAVTPKRISNLLLNATSMGLAHALRKPIIWGYPPWLMVEPTNICNLKCPMCPSGNGEMTRPLGRMDVDAFRVLIDEIGDYLMLVSFWNQGEPFIHKQFTEMVRIAKAKKIPTLTSTNGHFFHSTEAVREVIACGLDEMIVSLDGTNPESYRKYRVGGDFQRVLDGVQAVCTEKKRQHSKTPIINLQFIIFQHNEGEIDEIKRLAREYGVDKLTLKTAQIYTSEQAREYLPQNDAYRRYDYDGAQFSIRTKRPHGCHQLWYKTVVNWDGRVAPCCFDKNVDYELGNTFDTPFKQVWTGKRFQTFRRNILHSRDHTPMCQNCLEGVKGNFSVETRIEQTV
ncbi:MAG: radical SAM protein [Gemmatimonadetes bacterium]|nr:MAG: radical SAM protein [Gemmatimonadota bacterium]